MSNRPLHAVLVSSSLALAACGSEPAGEAAAGKADQPQAATAGLPRSPAPKDARVFFIEPADGDKVSNPVVVEFGAEGIVIAKAGDERPQSGHHHLIVDAGLPDLARPIPATDNYIHFGDGSTSTELTLAPGTHRLQLLLGDYLHVPHDPPLASEVITITVE